MFLCLSLLEQNVQFVSLCIKLLQLYLALVLQLSRNLILDLFKFIPKLDRQRISVQNFLLNSKLRCFWLHYPEFPLNISRYRHVANLLAVLQDLVVHLILSLPVHVVHKFIESWEAFVFFDSFLQ